VRGRVSAARPLRPALSGCPAVRPGGSDRARRAGTVGCVAGSSGSGERFLDSGAWIVFGVLFVGAALLLKSFVAVVVVAIVLVVALGIVLRVLRKRRAR
jgi:hypothetical protein